MTYKYITTDNRTVISPVSLHYALNVSHLLDVNKLTPKDTAQVSIFANDTFAELFSAAGKKDEPKTTEPNAPVSQSWLMHNYCVLVGDKIHIRNGREYKPLSSFLETADIEELKYVITQIANQAVLCRAELMQETDLINAV